MQNICVRCLKKSEADLNPLKMVFHTIVTQRVASVPWIRILLKNSMKSLLLCHFSNSRNTFQKDLFIFVICLSAYVFWNVCMSHVCQVSKYARNGSPTEWQTVLSHHIGSGNWFHVFNKGVRMANSLAIDLSPKESL